MSPSSPPPAAVIQLRHLIHYNLDNDLLQNALFLAGRLHGLDPRSPETVHLVALCHFKLGHFRAAYDYARPDLSRAARFSASSPSAAAQLGCAYVFAQACLALRRWGEGIVALERCRSLWQGRNYALSYGGGGEKRGPDAPAVCCLLGKLCRANGEEKKAAEWFAESLKGNPFMWDAFTELSDAGVAIRTANVFRLTDDLRRDLFANAAPVTSTMRSDPQPQIQALANKSTNEPFTPAGYDPFNTTRSAIDPGLNHGGPNLMSRLNNIPSIAQPSEWDTPVAGGIHYDEDVAMDESHQQESEAPPMAPMRKKGGVLGFGTDIDVPKIRGITTRGKGRGTEQSDETSSGRLQSGIPVSHKRTISGQPLPPAPPSTAGSDAGTSSQVRRSTRIQQSTASTASTMAKSSTASSRLAGVFSKDRDAKKDVLPKVRATGTKGTSTRVGTVGRNVSGNSKRFPPSLSDEKDTSRPVSQASTIRSDLAAPRKTLTSKASTTDVVIQQQAAQEDQRREEEIEGLKWLLDLFGWLGEAYFHLSRYDASKALEIFRNLPSSSRDTHWVLSKMGRALYESAKYKEAADVFARVRKLVPSSSSSSASRDSVFGGAGNTPGLGESAWMEDMHIYSTILWHLKRDIELAYLSHTLLHLDRLAPESWITLGNSFSLAREHDKAIRCFRRATQLAPSNGNGGVGAYAFTLLGHEHVALEEFDRATACYQEAISLQPRHYAGWYGLGSVYEKLGKYDVSEKHYRVAWNVNPRNGVLAVCLGLVSEKLGRDATAGSGGGGGNWVIDPRGESRVKEALSWYERAVRMDPKSAKARFMKARTLLRLAQMGPGGGAGPSRQDRLLQARDELVTLRDMAPEESMVHFLLGRCYKLLGDRAEAIREMTIAMELDPKATPAIKEALESLEADEEGFEDSDGED